MKKNILLITSLTALLAGCPLDGDKGPSGPEGGAGISCWDLNEDGLKTMPSEDTNSDGVIDVYDCRAGSKFSSTTTLVDSSTQTITHQHSRQLHSTASDIILFTGTDLDYQAAVGNWPALDVYVADPVQDPCGLWKWTDLGGGYALKAENSIVYEVKHMMALAFYSADPSADPHYGYEQCQTACQSDSNCVGAYYSLEQGTNNSLNCKLLRDVGFEIDDSVEFEALSTGEQGFVAGNIQGNTPFIGLISVCE